jgi:hypothetical protein
MLFPNFPFGREILLQIYLRCGKHPGPCIESAQENADRKAVWISSWVMDEFSQKLEHRRARNCLVSLNGMEVSTISDYSDSDTYPAFAVSV